MTQKQASESLILADKYVSGTLQKLLAEPRLIPHLSRKPPSHSVRGPISHVVCLNPNSQGAQLPKQP